MVAVSAFKLMRTRPFAMLGACGPPGFSLSTPCMLLRLSSSDRNMSHQFHHNQPRLQLGGSKSAGRRSTCALEDVFNPRAATLPSSALEVAWPSTSTHISRSTQTSMSSHDQLSMTDPS
jgi:hypothetical protein